MPPGTSRFVPAAYRGAAGESRRSRAAAQRRVRATRLLRTALYFRNGLRNGMSAAGLSAMATHSKRPSEAWTVPLHVVVWTAITVGFIMALIVLMMH
jgi:hypothetical protein